MADFTYTDESYPPVGPVLRYESGDGRPMTFQFTFPPDRKPGDMVPPPAMTADPQLETHGKHHSLAVAVAPNTAARVLDPKIFDHQDVGGRMTAILLLDGTRQGPQTHQQWLTVLAGTTPRDRVDIRIGGIGLDPAVWAAADRLSAARPTTIKYAWPAGTTKTAAMQRLLHDPARPVTTKWVLWVADASFCMADSHWILHLCAIIARHHRRSNTHVFAERRFLSVGREQYRLVSSAAWFRGKLWRLPNGRPNPTGHTAIYPSPDFWAATTEAIAAAGIPDTETAAKLGTSDWLIGEQFYQAGFGLRAVPPTTDVIVPVLVPVRRGKP